MSAGTLTLTNNSAAVTGSGTAFTTEVAAGDFIVVTVGGIPYTLAIKTVNSNTSLTLVSSYTGPTQAGAAWYAVPRVAMNLVTAALVAQSAEALRGLNYDKQNWQSIFSGTGNVTVTLPDGTTFTGPSWNYISTQFGGKLNTSGGTLTGQLNLRGAPIAADANSVISANGGLDVDMAKGFLLKGRVQQGDGRNNNILTISGDGNTGVTGFVGAFQYKWYADGWIAGITRGSGTNTLTYSIYYNGASYGTGSKLWSFNYDGSATSQGAWVNGSDERHKSNIEPVAQPLAAVLSLRGVTYDIQDGERGVGLIAQDVEKWCPDAVKTYGDRKFSDGTVIENFKFLDTSGVAAAYHTEAIKELFNLVELALNDPDQARYVIKAVKDASELSQSGS
ncbi:tail fiber domain-containing protein [Enterobacter cloacae]|uniref:tail fiber domain-containing protein n=1 Tax=Enterobacter cloacae TaxID=550 RepID=UPI00211D03C6|nr:tail fiber domain-containing protein [Enterobacter cloacae]MCQ9487230.1 tail fiber domain-containing protein [Enterobacter cloacae]MCQ9528799.1 tail fiber domain-containing protein [Enterobacter cloacae]MCQ9571780.1 tail fiber domain-containing protein [Enterobacter cloacae]